MFKEGIINNFMCLLYLENVNNKGNCFFHLLLSFNIKNTTLTRLVVVKRCLINSLELVLKKYDPKIRVIA